MAEKIAVTTEELGKKKEKWLKLLGQIEAHFAETDSLLNRLEQVFWGKPVEEIKRYGLKEQTKGMQGLKQLRVHLEKLGEIDAIYEQAERSNLNVTAGN